MGRRTTMWQVLLIKIHEINGSHVSSRARFLQENAIQTTKYER